MPIDITHARLLLARAALALGVGRLLAGYLSDAKQVIDSIEDVGVMREQHNELRERLDALETGADENSDPAFTDRELEVIAMLPAQLTTREIGEELFLPATRSRPTCGGCTGS